MPGYTGVTQNKDKLVYRFDFYIQEEAPVEYKPDVDFLSEFDIGFEYGDQGGFHMETLIENKTYKINGGESKVIYFPGFTCSFLLHRDPIPIIINSLFPNLVLGFVLLSVFSMGVDDVSDRVQCLAICLLAYIEIFF